MAAEGAGAAPLGLPLGGHSQSTLIDGRVLVCGGSDGDKKRSKVHLYSPARNCWSQAATMPQPRCRHAQATVVDGLVLVCGGWTHREAFSADAQVYLPATNQWTAVTPMKTPRRDHSVSTLTDGRALVCGGWTTGGKIINSVEIYNYHSNTWTPATPLPVPLFYHSQSTLADGRVLVCGQDASFVPTVCTYDPANDRWTSAPLSTELIGTWKASQTTLADGRVLVAGGYAGGTYRRTCAIYNPATDSWDRGPNLPLAMASHSASILLSGDVLVAGGSDGRNHLSQVHVLQMRAAAAIAAIADAKEAIGTARVEELRSWIDASPQLRLELFNIIGRIGGRSRPTELQKFYGVNSAVFKAVLNGLEVVIKVVYNVAQATDSNLSKTFKADYAVIEDPNKNHPNIVAGLGHFVGEASRQTLGEAWDADPEYVRLNTLFIVMEPMDRPLKKLISDLSNGRATAAWPPVLPLPVVKVVLQRVLRALLKLFRLGIVHRDLKADNVLINYLPATAQSQPAVHVKLADFGHALDTTAHRSIVNFRMPHLFDDVSKGGAPAYLAPEVVNTKAGTLDDVAFIDYSKNDVFAAGMLAHYMLTNGVKDAFAVHHPHYSATTYNQLPHGCPKPIADLVWAMVNPSFEQRITVEDALARVDSMI